MKSKIISKQDFDAWITELIKKEKTVGVKEKESGKFEFGALANAGELRLDYDVTVLPPKKFIQPAKETLLEFNTAKKTKIKAVVEAENLTIIGVHPYDMRAINQMDRVFEQDHRDTNYLERRKKITIIGVDPVRASKWSFWSEMGASSVEGGFDIWLTRLGDHFVAEAKTRAGEKLLKLAKADDATRADLECQKEARLAVKKLCGSDRSIGVPVDRLPSVFKTNHDHRLWEENAKKCYSCGSCNLVCPTCYCFDVREELDLTLKSGKRVRMWDGCLLEEFAAVGSGENFREERHQRYRHRLLRKMAYMPDKTGDLACVGCGRCSSVCLPDIADPVKIINGLKE